VTIKIQWSYLILLVLAVTVIGGCTAPTPSASPTAPVASPTTQTITATAQASIPGSPSAASVAIKGFSFQPQDLVIAPGGTVTWANEDGTAHTVKFTDGESSPIPEGGTYAKKFDSAGTYDYSCGIHPTMKGTVKVV
jgi:plastocyanin